MAQTRISMHRHRCYEIVYYATGTGSTRIGGTEFQYERNMYAIIPPGMLHDERRTEQTDVICAGFSLTSGEVPALQPGLYPDSPSSAILQTLQNISVELQEKRAYYDQKLSLYTSEMVIEHLRIAVSEVSSLPNDNLIYARTFIDENFTQKIMVQDLADMSGYSYHFQEGDWRDAPDLPASQQF